MECINLGIFEKALPFFSFNIKFELKRAQAWRHRFGRILRLYFQLYISCIPHSFVCHIGLCCCVDLVDLDVVILYRTNLCNAVSILGFSAISGVCAWPGVLHCVIPHELVGNLMFSPFFMIGPLQVQILTGSAVVLFLEPQCIICEGIFFFHREITHNMLVFAKIGLFNVLLDEVCSSLVTDCKCLHLWANSIYSVHLYKSEYQLMWSRSQF